MVQDATPAPISLQKSSVQPVSLCSSAVLMATFSAAAGDHSASQVLTAAVLMILLVPVTGGPTRGHSSKKEEQCYAQ